MTQGDTHEFTVNAFRYAQKIYQKWGFGFDGVSQQRNGMVSIPMK